MSKNPPIEMIKADGWEAQIWDEHAQLIDWAAQKAGWAAEQQAISFEDPKFGYVDHVMPDGGAFTSGQAWSSEQFVLYVDGRVINPTYRTAAVWSIDVFHEVVHCARISSHRRPCLSCR
jgi:hypothetical protein